MYVKMVFAQYKVKMGHVLQNMYFFFVDLMKYQPLESLE